MLTNFNTTIAGSINTTDLLRNFLNIIEEEKANTKSKRSKQMLNKYDVVLSDDMEELYSITHYEMSCNELKNILIQKTELKQQLTHSYLKTDNKFKTMLDKKKQNVN